MKIFNTMGRKLEEAKFDEEVKMYTCGPTVYNFVHIGNLRAFITYDLVKRYLKYKGYKVKHVMNITDIDDKTLRDSKKEGIPLYVFTSRYLNAFIEDLNKLKISMPDVVSGATQNIEEMVQLIQKLIDKGYAYVAEDGIYFSIEKFKDYGKLSQIDLKNLTKHRINSDEYDKENISDFALWKAWKPEEGDVFWNAEFEINGEKKVIKGRPGWHIECSTIAMKYLGETIDIHMGGVDLIFPHHENEIAQSEAATGKQFVRYWIHNAHLLVNNQKMSKSLGNFYTLRDLEKRGYNPLAFKLLVLKTHYRSLLNFTFDALEAAQKTLERLQGFYDSLESIDGTGVEIEKLISEYKKKFEEHMDNDFDTPNAMATLFEFISEVNKLIAENKLSKENAIEVKKFLDEIDSVFGLLEKEFEIPEEVQKLIEEREEARKAKDFKKADEIREKIRKLGFIVEDTPEGPKVKRALS